MWRVRKRPAELRYADGCHSSFSADSRANVYADRRRAMAVAGTSSESAEISFEFEYGWRTKLEGCLDKQSK